MRNSDLLHQFRARLQYKQARSWQKPWINPRRFLRNQLRKHGVYAPSRGELRTVDTFHVSEFIIVNGEAVSEQIASYGIYEEHLTEAFLRLIQAGQVVVDVGMHLGYYTTLFALLAGTEGQVHAFEPTPSTRRIAQQNLQRFPQVIVHPHAVWSSVETIAFRDYGPQWMAFNSFTDARIDRGPPVPMEFPVKTITLDAFRKDLGKKISLIKIDAESAEKQILMGAQQLIALDRPIITLEVGDIGDKLDSRPLIDFLASLEYSAWEFAPPRFARHSPRGRYEYDNLIFAPASADLSPF